MSEQLYRQVVKTDGDEGHWYDYEPAIELVRCHECVHSAPSFCGDGGLWCLVNAHSVGRDDWCDGGREEA